MQPRTIRDIITTSFFKLGKFSPSESIPADDASYALTELQGMLDQWNAQELFIFATDFLRFTLPTNVQPLTIGQGVNITAVAASGGTATYTARNTYAPGDDVSTDDIGTVGGIDFDLTDVPVITATRTQFTTAIAAGTVVTTTVAGKGIFSTTDDDFPNFITANTRPTKIYDANIILAGTNPQVQTQLRIRDRDWWMANTVPTVPGGNPSTDLFYDPKYPNGQIYLWPLQNAVNDIQLEVWNNLSDVSDLDYQFFMPPAYWSATTLSLAEMLISTYGLPPDRAAALVAQARMARMIVKDLNTNSLRIVTADSGIPKGGMRNRSFFNYLSGQIVGPSN